MDNNQQVQALLDIMARMESNNGQNVEHAKLSDGTNAVGKYGIKPSTAKDIMKRSPANMNDMDLPSVQQKLEQNPELQEQIARQLATKLLEKNKGQLDPAAMGWFQGQNRSMEGNKKLLNEKPLYQDRLDKVKQDLNIMPNLYNYMKMR